MDVYEAIRARRTIRDFEDRQVGMGTIERIIDAGLKAPTNNHLRQWEFVIVNGKEERANLLRVENMTSRDECEQMLDGFGMTDEVQRNMYREAMPRQFSMLYNAGCLILPFFKIREPLLQPSSLSSLNDFASIWCCIIFPVRPRRWGKSRGFCTREASFWSRISISIPRNPCAPCTATGGSAFLWMNFPPRSSKRG